MPGTKQTPPVAVVIAVADDVDQALQAALDCHGPAWDTGTSGDVVVLSALSARTAAPYDAEHHFVALLQAGSLNASIRVRSPRSRSTVGHPRRDRDASIEVNLSGTAGRFDRVMIPRIVQGATGCCLLAAVDGNRRSPVFGSLVAFVRPPRSVAVRLAPARLGLSADLALALRPDLIVLVGTHEGRALAAATSDLIAAELVALALREHDPAAVDATGPWEDPIVQRATELDLGVRVPSQIELLVVGDSSSGEAALSPLRDLVGARLGIPSSGARSDEPEKGLTAGR